MVAIVSGNSLGLELGSLRTLDPGGVFGSAATGRSGEQVYVNAANGNLVIQDRDEVLAGRGDDAVLWRTYNSQGLLNDDNGDNWISGTVLQPLALAGTLGTAGSTLARTDKDGSSAVYSWDAARTAYVTREGDGACDTIVLAGGQLEWRDGTTGARQRYEASGAYRLLASIDTAGNSLTYGYDAQGRKTGEVDGNGYATTWTYDYFGRLIDHGDLGGAKSFYSYDNARQLVAQSSTRGQSITYGYDAAGQQTSIVDAANAKTSTYTYDLAGRRLREKVVQAGVTFQDNHFSYDAQGNLRDVADARVHIAMDYDAAGNRTRVATTVNYQGAGSEATESSERFFRYDAMNRQTVVDAVDSAGTAGRQTHRIGYDLNGNRVSDTAWSANRVLLASGQSVITGYGADGIAMYTANAATSTHGEGDSTEVYRYDALNRLQSVVRDGVQVDVRLYDGAGRVVQSGPTAGVPAAMASLVRDALEGAATGKDIRINRYDANGRMLHQKVLTDQGAARSDTSWDPDEWIGQAFSRQRAAGYDAAGNVLGYATASSEGDRTSNAYVNTLVRREGYLAQSTAGTSSQLPPGSSTQQYDANGFLVGYADSRQPANNRTFVNDAAGRALWVNQAGNVQRQLVVNGEVLGLYGAAVASTGAGGNPNFANLADFDFGYARISASYPNASPGAYQVRPGDTLQSIAQAAYGDGHLWFRIAEANGLASSTALKVGQTLNLPATVGMGRNDATTFKPYDPSRIRGDMTPVMAMPSGGDGCGSAGKLLMVVVAVAVTVSIGPESGSALEAWWAAALESSPALATAATAATASAAGSIVGQLVGLASGTVRSFNWNEVAQAGVSGGISAGLANGVLKGSDLMTSATRAAVANAMTQGIGVVTGLQQRFDWRGVAASAVGTLVGKGVEGTRGTPANAWAAVATRTLKGIAAGTVTAVARGGRVAIQQIAVDAFGSGLAESLASSAHSPQEVFRSAEISDQNMTDRIETVLAKLHQSFVAKPMAPGTTSIANGGGGVGQILVASAALGEGIESFDNEVLARTLEFATLAPAPTLYKTATSSGHYYMIGAVGRSLGIPDAKLRRYMFYSQFPDQISAADGYTNGMRAFSMGLDYGPAKAGVIMMEAVHALNGRSTRENLITYQAIIDRFKTDDVVVGIALHALVDSVFHSKYDPSTGITVSFGSPAGHVREGSGQDYVSAKQVQVASAQVLIALETVAGLRLSAEQRQGAVNNVQMIIDRTHERTFEESSKMSRLGNFIGAMITVDERRDLNFRVVVEEMLGQGKEPPTWLLKPAPITNPIFGPMITAGQVNEQTRQFLNSRGAAFTLDEARVVAEEGMAGLERFVNAYRRDTNGGAPKADFQAAGLMDTRNWSLRKVPDRLAEVTFGTAWPMAGLLVGGALPFPIGKSLLDRVQGK